MPSTPQCPFALQNPNRQPGSKHVVSYEQDWVRVVSMRLMLSWKTLFILICTVACGASVADKGPVGLANLEQIDKLPYIYSGVRTMQVSSHDRTGGIGDAGKFLGSSGSEYIMMDTAGPGCVYRIWVTGVSSGNRIRIYLDGSTTPQIDRTVSEFFGGSTFPFLSPLVGDNTVSSGGFYCYLPIPFRTGCKVTFDNPNSYYNITYQVFSDADGVTTFTGNESASAVRVQWNYCGTDPKGVPDARTRTGTVSVSAGSTVTLIDETGPGSINRIKVSIPRLHTYDDISNLIIWNTRLRIYWDNEASPRVDAPIGPFFGSCYRGTTVRSLLIGTTTPSQFYCYFPMPFSTRARVQVYNNCPYGIAVDGLSYDIGIADMPDAASMLASQQIGYFAARWREENVVGGTPDFIMADAVGTGVAVGVSINMVGPWGTDRGYLEGDERIHYDGCLTPDLYGTGTEDFFNGGYYFDHGTFYRPLHGNPSHIEYPTDTTACYRLFLGDRIQYKNGFRAGLEHGSYNDKNGKYSCAFYFYEAGSPALAQTDMVDVGDSTSETAHSYVISGQTWSGTSTHYYEGDDDHVSSSDNGRAHNGYSQFNASIDPANGGVVLRRRMDYSLADQKAQVYVDGQLVGTWYDAGNNPYKSWRDTDFMIPAGFTLGKSSITVKMVYSSGGNWTEYRYWVFSVYDTSVEAASISGRVYAGGVPAQGVQITASPGDWETETNASGYYTLTPVQPGSYTVTARKFGYASQTKQASALAGQTTTLDFTLSPAQLVGSPSQAKRLPVGSWVRIDDLDVTAVFDALGRVYAQTPDRSSGIGVQAENLSVGDRLNITALSALVDGEIILTDPVIQITAQGQPAARPLALTELALGGGADGYQQGVFNDASTSAPAHGRNNIGILVRICGEVTYSNTSEGVFYVDDGSGVSDGSGHSGVRVSAAGMPLPSEGKQTRVTGISCVSPAAGGVVRLLRPRTSDDILYEPGPNLLVNPGFETGGQTGWTAVGSGGSVQCGTWFGDIVAHSGSCFNGLAIDGSTASGYLYQRVPVGAGNTCVASVWSCVYWGNNGSQAARNRIGLDPTGGTGTPGPTTVWSDWDMQPSAFTWAWHHLSVSAQAASEHVTFYLQIDQQITAGWHINCFDDGDCHEL